jgi:integrase/recombinase XerD
MFYEVEYDEYLASVGRSPGTRRHHRAMVADLVAFLAGCGIDDVKAVGEHHIEAYARELNGRGYAGKTVANYLIRVRVYFAFLEGRHIIFMSPAVSLTVPKYRPAHRAAFDNETLLALFERLDTTTPIGLRARAILELAYSAALRPREVRVLRLSDIDRAKGVLFIEQSKNEKDRIVPVGKTALEWLDRYVMEARSDRVRTPDDGAVFISHRTGGQLSPQGLIWAIESACKRVGIDTIPIYTMRASAATNLLESGMSIVHISRILGHSQIKTTQIYLRMRDRTLKDIVERSHPRFRHGEPKEIPA